MADISKQIDDIWTNIKEIYKELKELGEIAAAATESYRSLHGEKNRMLEKIKMLDESIHGNGNPGIKTEMRLEKMENTR